MALVLAALFAWIVVSFLLRVLGVDKSRKLSPRAKIESVGKYMKAIAVIMGIIQGLSIAYDGIPLLVSYDAPTAHWLSLTVVTLVFGIGSWGMVRLGWWLVTKYIWQPSH